jgi:hypothetical protein
MHHGSFFCQVMHRHLFDSVGPFADTLDGSTWCLADFSRRVWQAGFTTARCHGSLVYTTPEQVFGSTERRLKLQEESEHNYAGRWETPASYCLCLAEIQSWWPTILTGARQGDTFVIVTPAALAQRLREDGLDRQHEGITFSPLPRLLPERRGRQMLARLLSAEPTLHVATDTATLPLPPGIAVQSITTIADKIIEREKRLYGRPPAKEH